MLTIEHPSTGAKLEVANQDLDEMNWEQAKRACNDLGDGWRLPTEIELEAMHEQLHKKGKGNFNTDGYYWSISGGSGSYAWYFDFNYGGAYNEFDLKDDPLSVRAVRLVKDTIVDKSKVEVQDEMTVDKMIENTKSTLKKYRSKINEETARNLITSNLYKIDKDKIKNVRYIVIEDENIHKDYLDFCHFYADDDKVNIWEKDFLISGCKPYELEEDGFREGAYLGFIDLIDLRYTRVDGLGDEVEFGSSRKHTFKWFY
jgi:hypothetical protein